MFCPEGYISLSELKTLLSEYAQYSIPDLEAHGPRYMRFTYGEADAYSDWLMMSFLIVFADKIRVVLSSGSLVKVDASYLMPAVLFEPLPYLHLGKLEDSIFEPPDWESNVKTYSQFPADKVGRMKSADFSLPYVDHESMTFRRPDAWSEAVPYQNHALDTLHSMPLCVSTASIPSRVDLIVSEIEKEIRNRWNPSNDPPKERDDSITERIVNAFREGVVRNKSEARRKFAQNIKVEEFRAVWRQVAEEIPEVSKPGPRPNGAIR